MKKSLSFSVSSIARNLILLFLISHSSFLTAQPCGTPVPYNGYTYNTVQVGSYCWMTDNLRTTVDATGNPIAVALIYQSNMHPDTVANLAAFGRLYSWYSAVGLPEGSTQKPTVNAAGYVQGICPNGWYLPTQEAFDELHAFAIEALCSDNPAYWLGHIMNNSTDLSFVPGGYYHPNSSMYNHLLGDAYYWISDTTLSTTKPMCHILYGCPVLELGTVNAHTGYSVRCVQKIPLEVTCPLSGDTAVSQNSGANYKHTGTGWDATTPTAGATLSYTLSGATTGSGTTLDNVTFNPGLTTVTWKATMGEKADSCSFTVHVTSKLKTCTDCEGDITVMDIDGNIYQAKTMPDGRVWMIENLRTTKYANGDAIREWTNEWITADNGNYKPYFVMPSKANLGAFTSDKDTLWGYYYNWAAAMGLASDDNGQGITTDQGLVQGICPAGWHLPSQKERDTLIQRIAGIGITLGSTTDSSAVRMACTNSGWNNGYLTNSGSARQNETCFSAVPAGYYFGGNVNYSGGNAYFWSSTPNEINAFNTYNYYFIANYRYVYPTINHKYYGFSVRCVRDDAPPSTVDITCPFSGDTTVIQNGGFNYKHSGTGWDATTTVAGATLSYTLSGATTGSGTTLNNVTFNLGTTTVKWKATLGAEADSCSFRVNVATNIPACPACIGETTVTDVDGNVYQARTMPDGKMWMIENLRTTKYANGDTIRKRTNEWVIGDDDYKPYFVKPSQATPDGGGSFTFDKDTLWGYYYNWAAAVGLLMNISGNGDNLVTPDANGHVQGICPAGWHLPSDAEWATLRDSTDNLDGNAGNNNEAVYMACTNSGWNTGDLTAASNGAAQNSTCFSAPPAGSYFNGTVFNSGNFAYFWSTTPAEGTAYGAYYYGFSYYYRNVFRYDGNKVLGFSVRCVRD